ncbi:MAG TPA: DUF6351 family protein [Xanthobacteraceae bacterium]|nr:DUF6351 family protein [Xanthobacteraceae bacterium]
MHAQVWRHGGLQAITSERFVLLKQTFPDGVCDYAKPGVEQARLVGVWVLF